MKTRREIIKAGAGVAAILATGRAPAAIVRSMLGARSAITAKKSGGGGGGWTNPYSTNGLTHFWDGEWNVAGGEHDASATTWADLVGNINLALNGSASFGSNYMETTDESSGAISDAAISAAYLEIVFVNTYSTTGWYSLIDDLSNVWLWCEPKWLSAHSEGLSVVYWGKMNTLADGMTNLIALRLALDGSVARANNVDMTEEGPAEEHGLGAFSIFGNVNNIGEAGCCQGRCYSCRIYSSIPTAAERAANYAVDVARFGLPTA